MTFQFDPKFVEQCAKKYFFHLGPHYGQLAARAMLEAHLRRRLERN